MTDAQLALLSSRLNGTMHRDIHQEDGSYEIRSLYFDDISNCGMEENEAGVDQRKKYRIRIYNADPQVIHLERKEKYRGFIRKNICSLSLAECIAAMEGTLPIMPGDRNLLNLLQLNMRCCHLQPKVIIRYERTAFVYPAGNVRITMDRNIEASLYCQDFLEEQVRGMTPVLPAGLHILEVKYDEFLPDFIAQLLETGDLRQTPFSKYYWGRLAVTGSFSQDH